MKLLTKEIIAKLPPLYSTDNIATEDKRIIVKFFCPWNSWTWYVVEGELAIVDDMQPDPKEWLFFGLVEGFAKEWGYFSLNELEAIRGPAGLRIERDKWFKPQLVKDSEAK